MSATPRTDALEKAVSLGMIGTQLFAEVRKMERELEAMTEGLKIASACACDFTITRHPCGTEDFTCGCEQMMARLKTPTFEGKDDETRHSSTT